MEWLASRLRSKGAHPTPTTGIPHYPPPTCLFAKSRYLHRPIKYPHPKQRKQADGEHGHRISTARITSSGDGHPLVREAQVPRGIAVLGNTVEKLWEAESGGGEVPSAALLTVRIIAAVTSIVQ